MIIDEGKYERHILILQDFAGFYEKWTDMIPDYKTHEEAYEHLENLYAYYFGKRRYKNFESFRTSIHQWRANKSR